MADEMDVDVQETQVTDESLIENTEENKEDPKKRKGDFRGLNIRFHNINVEDEYSSFYCVEKSLVFPLLPATIGQELRVVNQTLLHKWKGSFIKELNGILCFFDNLQILDDNPAIMDDLPFIYIKIRAKFYVFRPTVNALVRAKITCFSEENSVLNCSIADCFNTVINLPEDMPEKLNDYLILNQEIFFRVTEISYNPMIVYGEIDKKCIKLIRKKIPIIAPVANKSEEANLDTFFMS